MNFWVDGDSCATPAREMAARRAARIGVHCYFVACRELSSYEGALVCTVASGPDAADNEIVERIQAGDLVVTRDLKLAQRVLEKGAFAMNDRGEVWTADSLRERISLAEYAKVLYDTGIETRGSKRYGRRDAESFARGLDKWLGKFLQRSNSDDAARR